MKHRKLVFFVRMLLLTMKTICTVAPKVETAKLSTMKTLVMIGTEFS